MPEISVLFPFRNAAATIGEAIDSICSQEGVELEIIAVDDGSTDESRAIVEARGDPRARVLPSRGRGIVAALETARAAAREDIAALEAMLRVPPDMSDGK